jgi:hypothetical protein
VLTASANRINLAWSDAAREAALETRRSHLKTKPAKTGRRFGTQQKPLEVHKIVESEEDNLYPQLKSIAGKRIDEGFQTVDQPKPLGSKLAQAGKAAIWLPHHIEHAIKAGVTKGIGHIQDLLKAGSAGWNTKATGLDPASIAGKTINGVKFAASSALKVAYAPWIAGAKAVEAVAKAKGLSDADAAKVRSLTTCYDCIACKAIVLGFEHAGLAHIGALSTLVPTASAAYLAVSTAQHPIVVGKLAAKAVVNVVGKAGKALVGGNANKHGVSLFSRTDDQAKQSVGVLASAVKKHAGNDWFFSLLTQAMSHAKSAPEAVAIAEKAFKKNPKPKLPKQTSGKPSPTPQSATRLCRRQPRYSRWGEVSGLSETPTR